MFNVGRTDENYRKADLVELIRAQTPAGTVEFVHRDEDPRDYKVGFERVARELGFTPAMTVPEGIAEILAALDGGRFGDPFDPRHRNVADPTAAAGRDGAASATSPERRRQATGAATAPATASTTRSCCSSVMCANSGSVIVRAAYSSVTGSSARASA